jgi:hypothetical protein
VGGAARDGNGGSIRLVSLQSSDEAVDGLT